MVTDDDLALLRRYADLACFSASSLNEPRLNARGGEALRRLLDEHAELSGRLGAAAWVPCAEKAPPEPGEYMAVKQWWKGNGELHREAAALGWYSNRWEELVNGMPAIGEVTHWLRIPDLPAPPKE